ncbi:plasmid pRiA4b ORF-3 family protein [Pseudomonas aeruginosa]|uniref:plasmid pRiA4b ORF-3 family protein n=1 Tax=Pseudomonas aeruginosa TaxID=287 RepID=UPI001F3EE9B6|nr:plasmid pRiA4b ORF-3 family protein [Pseudomonas aeruginosa]MDG4230972.1 plasmid pRiA4b ORF-3 family protein [Pseudomonas aeruginosa]USI81172.1 plasmid pRiA4b ORF-3 family protein [Pseudomonas aeruginosa]
MAVSLNKDKDMATQPMLYTLHIQLEPLQLDPPIWRRIRVSGDCTLRKLCTISFRRPWAGTAAICMSSVWG